MRLLLWLFSPCLFLYHIVPAEIIKQERIIKKEGSEHQARGLGGAVSKNHGGSL